MRRLAIASLLACGLAGALPGPACAQVPPGLVLVGGPEVQEGLRIAVAYLRRAVSLEPAAPPVEPGPAIHLQVEVEAASGNAYGFDPDESVPYLRLPFTLVHEASGRRLEGTLEPMVSRDGFHYGANVLLAGGGSYVLTVDLHPPDRLARHTDPRTGVSGWWKSFKVTRRFTYAPD